MTIAKKLYALILTAMLGLLALTGLSMQQLDKVNTAAGYATANTVPSVLALSDAQNAFSSLNILLWRYLATTDPALKNDLEKSMTEAQGKVIAAFNLFEKEDISDDMDGELLKVDRQAFAEYGKILGYGLKIVASGKVEDAKTYFLSQNQVINSAQKAIENHKNYNVKLGKEGAENATATIKTANMLAVLIALLIGTIMAISGIIIVRKIVSSLNEAVAIAKAIAQGDLTREVNVSSNDEIGELMKSIGEMSSSLTNIVSDVRTSVSTIATASGEIASGNLDLSSRTEAQAGSLEETASAMEELTATVNQNADNARQANQLAATASEVASEGGAVVNQVVSTMEAINTSSRKIVDIISVIDGIAFQTNILALNAAVEAARAGEQGRGFAVVASEVRTLAQRSAAAAKEIKELIDDSVSKVEEGSKLVAQAGSTMEQVVSSVRHVTHVVSEISAASGEQSEGIGQVNQAITQMDEATQQNAALVEEAAAASQSLQEQARQLEQAVSVFKLGSDHDSSHPAHSPTHIGMTTPTRKPSPDINHKNTAIARNMVPMYSPKKTGTRKVVTTTNDDDTVEQF